MTPELTRCARRSGVGRVSEGLLAWQTEAKDQGGFEVSEGDVADYVECVGGRAFVSSERRWKMGDEAGRQIAVGKWGE